MSAELAGKSTHKAHVSASAGVVYALIADAVRWPLYFAPCVHVEQLDSDGGRERLRMWCLVDGELKSWTSWRRLDPVERRVEFQQELQGTLSSPMGGALTVRPDGPQHSVLELEHRFSAASGLLGEKAEAQHVAEAAARAGLANLKAVAEQWTRLDDLVLSFEDAVHINGPAELIYDFLYRVGDWPELVPHVTRVDLTEDVPGVQHMTMETVTEYGTRTTDSVRICFPHAERIVYKQSTTPTLLHAHTGEWSVLPDEKGVTVIAQQSIVLSEELIAATLGENAGLAHARQHVREELGRNCRVLLAHVKKHAESAVRML